MDLVSKLQLKSDQLVAILGRPTGADRALDGLRTTTNVELADALIVFVADGEVLGQRRAEIVGE